MRQNHPFRCHPKSDTSLAIEPNDRGHSLGHRARYLLRDRNASYGPAFRDRLRVTGIEEVVTAPRSPWQNPFVERLRRSTLNFQHRE
jgi:hypothetical protein